MKRLSSKTRSIRGATLVEYVLLISLIAVLAIGALQFLGRSANQSLNNTASAVNSAAYQ